MWVLSKLEKEERRKEIRQQKLNSLDFVENWLNDVRASVEDLTVLRELSDRDESDGALIVPREKWKPIEEELLRLETRGYTILVKLSDINDEDLIVKTAVVWTILEKPRESLGKGVIPGTHPIITSIADALQALEKARIAVLEYD